MPSPIDSRLAGHVPLGAADREGHAAGTLSGRLATEWLADGQARESAGCLPEAIACYEACLDSAGRGGERAVTAEALRRLAAVHHKRGDTQRARDLCAASYSAARAIPDHVLAAGALNTLGVVEMMSGAVDAAEEVFHRALRQGGAAGSLRARVDQNLGILANIRGRASEARAWYQRSLDEYLRVHDDYGCAIAYHNLAMLNADGGRYDAAERHLRASRVIAEQIGDLFLKGLCLLEQGEVDCARQRFENARQNAEAALALFDQMGAVGAKSDAYRVLGMVYRETGQLAVSESRLRSAIALAVQVGSVLSEAEATRELALTCLASARNQDALRLLHAAHGLFGRLDAHADLVNVGNKMEVLENAYRAVVRAWGESIESADRLTYGHCERVAQMAVAVARTLELDEHTETTVLLGAYLHDVGKIQLPHELLRKIDGRSAEEQALFEQHPVWGTEMLADVDFPWDLKSVVRWHHERRDGTGYPDGLLGDEIPIAAQIVGIVNYYDEWLSGRHGSHPPTRDEAVAAVRERAGWWSASVMKAFLTVVAAWGTRPG